MTPRKGQKTNDATPRKDDVQAADLRDEAKRRLDDTAWRGPAYNLVQHGGHVNGTLYGPDAIEYAKANNGRVMRRDLLGLETLREFNPDDARRLYDAGNRIRRYAWYVDVLVERLILPARFYTKGPEGKAAGRLPWDRAADYVTDGKLYGVLFDTGMIEWVGDSLQTAFGPELHD